MGLSKVLIIGATGYIGKHIAQASLAQEHPTYLLVRPSASSDPTKTALVDSFKALGAVIIPGSIDDDEILLAAIKQVDVVISTIGKSESSNQVKLLAAIKKAGNIKRFLPSEFGIDVGRPFANEVLKLAFDQKRKARAAVVESGIPYTLVSCSSFAGCSLVHLGDLRLSSLPSRDHVTIFGDGNTKAVFVVEEDVASYTIKAIDDPRTENKILYIRPSANILTQREIVELWEGKIGKKLEKKTLTEEEILKQLEEIPYPKSKGLAYRHGMFVKGNQFFEIDSSNAVEATELYPDVKYITAEEYLDQFV